jgi:hypothetical protein
MSVVTCFRGWKQRWVGKLIDENKRFCQERPLNPSGSCDRLASEATRGHVCHHQATIVFDRP